ncbi:cytochrome c biogenesis heme-transporting ATPase CcmA [Ferrovibrio sp.]|uniref:cytochrome c biogenesis heme-transporting ATPase CcmA n=1 Tax=Ferrovibrio sp. TaxID=1917215 RepID=UPI001B555DE7|nr:cytochrome c biogenesis heme-transporting ATPase CcmA [Ferrovibrio sp.]MBP7064173.1 cytochrome c biogenesis heme-transporting ATPase CcmA [Ferrovibrio sp.]
MMLAAERLAVIRGERQLFKDVSFSLAPGEALLLRGPNGSGKSSLLRLLAGFLAPAAGRLLWQGQDVAHEPEDYRAGLLYLGHQDAVQPQISAEDNLIYWARLAGLGAAAAAERSQAALEQAGLGRQRRLPGRYLSAGQKRRLGLARLLLRPAALWLLDEPTNALDSAAITWLGAALARHRAAGGLVLLASHVDVPLPQARCLELPSGQLA